MTSPKRAVPTVEQLRQRLGPVDELQIRLLLRVSPAQRITTMWNFQQMMLQSRFHRLRKIHPNLSNLEICRLMFSQLARPNNYDTCFTP